MADDPRTEDVIEEDAEDTLAEAGEDGTAAEPSGPGGKKPYIEIGQDTRGKWHWVLWAGNGRPMAINAIPYNRRNDVTTVLEKVRETFGQTLKIIISHKG